MKTLTRQYVLSLLLDLAFNREQGPITLKEIAARQGLPFPYLKHLTARLVGRGILRSARGSKGGVSLARAPEEIKLNEIIQALEIPVVPIECLDDLGDCDRSSGYETGDIWIELEKKMEGVLGAITLRDLMERQVQKEKPVEVISVMNI